MKNAKLFFLLLITTLASCTDDLQLPEISTETLLVFKREVPLNGLRVISTDSCRNNSEPSQTSSDSISINWYDFLLKEIPERMKEVQQIKLPCSTSLAYSEIKCISVTSGILYFVIPCVKTDSIIGCITLPVRYSENGCYSLSPQLLPDTTVENRLFMNMLALHFPHYRYMVIPIDERVENIETRQGNVYTGFGVIRLFLSYELKPSWNGCATVEVPSPKLMETIVWESFMRTLTTLPYLSEVFQNFTTYHFDNANTLFLEISFTYTLYVEEGRDQEFSFFDNAYFNHVFENMIVSNALRWGYKFHVSNMIISGGNIGGNIGGGGSVSPSPEPPYPQQSELNQNLKELFPGECKLSPEDIEKLNQAYFEMRETCFYECIDNYLLMNNVRLRNIELRDWLGQVGISVEGDLCFFSSNDITAENLKHEWIHIFQKIHHKMDKSYGNKVGMMEFEVALVQDILYYIDIKGKSDRFYSRTWSCWNYFEEDYKEQYMKWLEEMTRKGEIYPEEIDKDKFMDFSNIFGDISISYNRERGYKYGKDMGYEPSAIRELFRMAKEYCKP